MWIKKFGCSRYDVYREWLYQDYRDQKRKKKNPVGSGTGQEVLNACTVSGIVLDAVLYLSGLPSLHRSEIQALKVKYYNLLGWS